MSDSIFKEPINGIIEELNNGNKKIKFLIGNPGTGKTTVLETYIDSCKSEEKIVFNGTIDFEKYIFIPDEELYKLYLVSLLLEKMLLNIKGKYSKEYSESFMFLDNHVKNIIRSISFMFITNNYNNKYDEIDEQICYNPELLLEKFLIICKEILNIKEVTIILDNFDRVGYSSNIYQQYIYSLLKKYVNLIISIEDTSIIYEKEKLDKIRETSEIILVDYSYDVETVTHILDLLLNNSVFSKNEHVIRSIKFVLSEDTIKKMIILTNGNLNNMFLAVRYLYNNKETLLPEEYEKFLLNYIEQEICKDEILSGYVRTLNKLKIEI